MKSRFEYLSVDLKEGIQNLVDFWPKINSQQNTLLNDYHAKMSLVLFDRFGGGFSAIL